jgi:hypothetical protein
MNLQDHPTSGLGYDYLTDLPLNPGLLQKNKTFAHHAHEEFKNNRTGPYSGSHNAVIFLPGNTFLPDPERYVHDITAQTKLSDFLPAMYHEEPTLIAGFAAQRRLIRDAVTSPHSTLIEVPIAGDPYLLLILQKPLSRGTITIDPKNPYNSAPVVDFHTFYNPLDITLMLHMLRFARKFTQTSVMKQLTPEENWPGNEKQSDQELYDHIRGMAGSSIGHESGTCAMLPKELGGVVDTGLNVYGTTGLSVADASIMPLIPSTNLCATVYAVAEKAADLIKGRHGMRRGRLVVQ